MTPDPSTVLVTGATGFVGRSLCTHLRAQGRRVIASSSVASAGPWSEHRAWNLEEGLPTGLLEDVDSVFHLASRAHTLADTENEIGLYDKINHHATGLLVHAATEASVAAFVFVSSTKAEQPDGPVTRTSAYAFSKWHGEQAVLAAAGKLHVAVARPALVYGPGVKGNLLQLLRAIDRGHMPALPAVANRRSMVGLNDFVCSLEVMSRDTRAAGRTFTVTDGQLYSTHRILDALSTALGKGPVKTSKLPIACFRGLARAGDLAEGLTRRRMPISSDVYDKLLGSAEYSSADLGHALDVTARESLEIAAPCIVHAYRMANLPRDR